MVEAKRMVAGFNHNVRHAGKLYHVQTEDSGVGNPRITTHLFVGGNIIASKSTTYADLLGAENLASTVRALMEEQHKAILRNLVNGLYDDAAYGEKARAYQPGQLAVQPPGEVLPEPAPVNRAVVPDARAVAEPLAANRAAPAPPAAAPRPLRPPAVVVPPGPAPAVSGGTPAGPPVRAPAPAPAAARPVAAPPGARGVSAPPPPRAVPPPVPTAARPAPVARPGGPPPHHGAIPRTQMPALTPPPMLRRGPPATPASGSSAPVGGPSARPSPRIAGGGRAMGQPAAQPPAGPHPALDEPLDTLFADDLVSEKSLDEVILSYLAEDPRERK